MMKNIRLDYLVAWCTQRIVERISLFGGGVLYLADEEFDRFRYMCVGEWNAVCRALAGTIDPDDKNP